jgi:beta-phosphoglucomutase-like phosphatase (HAD superfamily)
MQQAFIGQKENCIVIEDSTNGNKAAVAGSVGYNSVHSAAQDLSL